jgi:hypothetical protein
VKRIMTDRSRRRQQRVALRLDKSNFPDDLAEPMIRAANIHYEIAERAVGTPYGGIGLVHQLAKMIGLPAAIDQRLHLFKIHLPYHESDHVLNIAYNALCDARCLQDLELRRQDEAYLNALGASRIPDPTTAGDFCRRFQQAHLDALQEAIDTARRVVWAKQPASFFEQAIIDGDGTMVETDGECKQGMDISYKGQWGYHPLAITLANTGEVLRLVNRSGNRPSHEGAAAKFDEGIALCRAAGFRSIRLRGDTDFSQTQHLDRWHEQDVVFCFGLDVTALRHILADDLPGTAFKPLKRPAKYQVRTKTRKRPERVKQQIVEQRGFKDIRLVDEWVAEMPYRPVACKRNYRLIVLRKNLEVSEPRQQRLFDDYIYFLYLTNDWDSTPAEIVFDANDRCQQENVLAQLNAVRALHAPLDNLLSNNAYMLITSLAWNLKAWLALSLPEPCGFGKAKQAEQKRGLLTMEFRTFVNFLMRVPAQIVRTGRRLVIRLLAWNQWQPVFLRLAVRLCQRQPLRC